eukprot:CAMPEP_0197073368 /NCGR_PEP_ID=MMETSP1384-20130603/210571_1 /TAXON_ID=29189 /ORGANISM="Ammonia sp." /LENGTH=348 /DNA_ID=CAMNT_0042512205 /DNA_START=1 /DNA_END=1047 /DNA_ORIENTATION=-
MFFDKFQNPSLVQQAIRNWKVETGFIDDDDDQDNPSNLIKLSYADKEWVSFKLDPTPPKSDWERKTMSLVHRFEVYTIWTGLIGWIITFVAHKYVSGYRFLFLQIYLLRLFTLIESNQRLIVLIFTIVPHFVNLLAFAFIFIFIWARIGCTIFADKKDIVGEDVYETGANASFDTVGTSVLTLLQLMVGEGWHEIMYLKFDTVGTSVLTLLQLMVGEGWHEIMYLNMIATKVQNAAYFIIYIIFVTLIISNIFVGLFLSEIEELDSKQSEDQLLTQYRQQNRNWSKAAITRKRLLVNKLNTLKNQMQDTEKQIQRINHLLDKQSKSKSKRKLSANNNESHIANVVYQQ